MVFFLRRKGLFFFVGQPVLLIFGMGRFQGLQVADSAGIRAVLLDLFSNNSRGGPINFTKVGGPES
ncbi:MAG: hypothetical protein DSZ23_02115 [Thermodesulfatator sp.]|nr:MAG: hypothetical protein DSZ23_02115 [Thermodesulfatator sp.]